MLLYDSPVSGNCYKVRLLLAHLGLAVRAADGRRRRPLEPARAARRAEPGAPRADARPRRRPAARRVGRDPLVLRRGHALRPGRPLRAGAGAPVDVLRAVRPRAGDRRRALLARVLGPAGGVRRAARGADRRRLPGARRDGARTSTGGEFFVGDGRRSPTSRSTPTRTSRDEGGFDLARIPAIRGVARPRRGDAGARPDRRLSRAVPPRCRRRLVRSRHSLVTDVSHSSALALPSMATGRSDSDDRMAAKVSDAVGPGDGGRGGRGSPQRAGEQALRVGLRSCSRPEQRRAARPHRVHDRRRRAARPGHAAAARSRAAARGARRAASARRSAVGGSASAWEVAPRRAPRPTTEQRRRASRAAARRRSSRAADRRRAPGAASGRRRSLPRCRRRRRRRPRRSGSRPARSGGGSARSPRAPRAAPASANQQPSPCLTGIVSVCPAAQRAVNGRVRRARPRSADVAADERERLVRAEHARQQPASVRIWKPLQMPSTSPPSAANRDDRAP